MSHYTSLYISSSQDSGLNIMVLLLSDNEGGGDELIR